MSRDQLPTRDVGLERIIFFSDAVMAIAITLLVLEIRLPELPHGASSAEVARALVALAPRVLSYLVSFVLVGTWWNMHHVMYRHIVRYDGGLVALNLLVLCCVAFLPFPAAVLGRHGDTVTGLVFYSASVSAAGFAQLLLWSHATRRRKLVAHDLDRRVIRGTTTTILVPALVALASTGFAFLSRWAWLATWAVVFPLVAVARRRMRRRGAPAA